MSVDSPEGFEGFEQAGGPPPDDEAVQEALAELRRQEEAEKFAPPPQMDVPSGYIPPVVPRRGYMAPAQQGAREPMIGPDGLAQLAMPKEPKTIEDLFVIFPKIGDGNFRLRVERTYPKVFGGRQVAGWLDDLDEQIPMSEFSARYGGGKYTVSVMGPIRSPRADTAETPMIRRLKHIEVVVPGNPSLTLNPKDLSQEEMMAMQQVPYTRMQQGAPFSSENPEVAKKKIEVEQTRWEREQDEKERIAREHRELAEKQAEAPRQYVDALSRASTVAIEKVERSAEERVSQMRAQYAESLRRLDSKDEEIKGLRTMLDTERKQSKDLETEEMRRIKDDHRREMDALRKETNLEVEALKKERDGEVSMLKARLEQDTRMLRDEATKELGRSREDQSKELARIRDENAKIVKEMADRQRDDMSAGSNKHSEEITRLTSAHLTERARVESEGAKERERLMQDAIRREQQLKDDFERERRTTKDTFDARISDVDRSSQREITSLKEQLLRETTTIKEQRDREVDAVRSQFSMKADLAKNTADLRVDNNNAEIGRLRSEVESIKNERDGYRREAEQLRIASHKDPVTAITEAQTLAQLVGWGPQQEEKGSPEEEGDWKKMAARGLSEGIKRLAENAPDLVDKFANMRAQGQHNAEMQMRMQMEQARMEERQRMVEMGMGPQNGGGMPILAPAAEPPPQQAIQQQPQQPQRPLPNRARPQPLESLTPPPLGSDSGGWAPPIGMPAPIGGNYPAGNIASPIGAGGMPQQDAAPPPPVPGMVPQPPPPVQRQQPVAPQPVAQPRPAPVAAQQPQPAAQPQGQLPSSVTQEAVMEFLAELESAITMRVVSPALFAKEFIERVGPQATKDLLASVNPDQLIQGIASTPDGAGTAIVTREGQKFVKQLWVEAAKQVRAAGIA